jgi:hypothetical protein
MPQFEIEQYELHSTTHRVKAATMAEAIVALWNGESEIVDNSTEYIEVPENVGMPADHDVIDALRRLGYECSESHIPGIRSIK